MSKYMKDNFIFYGIPSHKRKEIEKDFINKYKDKLNKLSIKEASKYIN